MEVMTESAVFALRNPHFRTLMNANGPSVRGRLWRRGKRRPGGRGEPGAGTEGALARGNGELSSPFLRRTHVPVRLCLVVYF